jgi:hypothetical protein
MRSVLMIEIDLPLYMPSNVTFFYIVMRFIQLMQIYVLIIIHFCFGIYAVYVEWLPQLFWSGASVCTNATSINNDIIIHNNYSDTYHSTSVASSMNYYCEDFHASYSDSSIVIGFFVLTLIFISACICFTFQSQSHQAKPLAASRIDTDTIVNHYYNAV